MRTLPLTTEVVCTTERGDFAFEFNEHALAFEGGGLAGFADDLLGLGDGLLRFLLLNAGGGGAGFLDELGGLDVGLFQDLLLHGFGAGQFRLDLVGVGQALGDALAALFQDGEDGFVGKFDEKTGDEREADDLREEMRPVQAEGFCGVVGARSPPMLPKKIKCVIKSSERLARSTRLRAI